MGTVQKFLVLSFGLGAAYLAVAHPDSVYKLASAGQKLVGGTVTQITTAGKAA